MEQMYLWVTHTSRKQIHLHISLAKQKNISNTCVYRNSSLLMLMQPRTESWLLDFNSIPFSIFKNKYLLNQHYISNVDKPLVPHFSNVIIFYRSKYLFLMTYVHGHSIDKQYCLLYFMQLLGKGLCCVM